MKLRTCVTCGNGYPSTLVIDGSRKSFRNRKECLICHPYDVDKGKFVAESIRNAVPRSSFVCLGCKEQKRLGKNARGKFCGPECQNNYQYKTYIERWLKGEETGNKASDCHVSHFVRRYLFEKFDSKCSRCGWNEKNPRTGKCPLETEHIDGNWKNSAESNLTLLCPNCHSITESYGKQGNGQGRPYIVKHLKYAEV